VEQLYFSMDNYYLSVRRIILNLYFHFLTGCSVWRQKMKKCISCKSEIPLQARFCEKCGVLQPIEKGIDQVSDISTIRNSLSATGNTLLPTPLIPPPPPQSEEEKEDEDEILEVAVPEFPEHKPGDTGSTGHIDSQSHGTHQQAEETHTSHHQPQQLHRNHLQPQQTHSDHLQPQQIHSDHSQQLYGDHHQSEAVHGSHHQAQQTYGSHLQTRRPANSMSPTRATIAKVGTTVTKTGTAIVGKWVIITVIVVTVLGASSVGFALIFHPFHLIHPGQSHTPGPNGAPPDDANFTIQLNIQARDNITYISYTYMYTLVITGHPDSTAGTVCAPRDNGTPVSGHNFYGGQDNATSTYACNGIYKGGTVSYSETLKTQTFTTGGLTCTLNSPQQSFLQITGSYTDQHNFSGNATELTIDSSMYTCNQALSAALEPGSSGTWTGTVS
jgi:hypothetical protein